MKVKLKVEEVLNVFDEVIELLKQKTGVLIEPLMNPDEKAVKRPFPLVLSVGYQVLAPTGKNVNNPKVVDAEQRVVVEKIIDKLIINGEIFKVIEKALAASNFVADSAPMDLPTGGYYSRSQDFNKKGDLNKMPLRISVVRSPEVAYVHLRFD